MTTLYITIAVIVTLLAARRDADEADRALAAWNAAEKRRDGERMWLGYGANDGYAAYAYGEAA